MLLRRVKDANDKDVFAFDAEEYLVGKPVGQDASKAAVEDGKPLGRLFQASERLGYGKKELVAQSWAPGFVPIPGLAKIGIGRGAS